MHALAALLALAPAACGRTGLDAPVDVKGTAGTVGVAGALGAAGTAGTLGSAGTAGAFGIAGDVGTASTSGTAGAFGGSAAGGMAGAAAGDAGGAAVPWCYGVDGGLYSGDGTSCPGNAKLNGHPCWQNCQYSQVPGPVIPIPNGAPACLAPFGAIETGPIVACVQSCAQCTP